MPDTDRPLIEMRGISKRFGRVQALEKVDLDVRKGEIMGLVGDNGAGKSTLIRTLVGIHEPDEGEVRIRGEPVNIRSPREAHEYGIATVYQDLALVDQLTVAANMFLGRTRIRRLGGLVPVVDWPAMREEAERTLRDRLNFEVPVDSKVEFLSGGERQAVAIGRALVTNPEIVILDEPTSALSADAARRVIDLVERLREEGLSVIIISHSLEEVFSLTDRLTILHAGRRVGSVRTADVTQDEVVGMMISGTAVDAVDAGRAD